MTALNVAVYNRLQRVTDEVRQQLARKGIAIPVKNQNGTITLGHYTVCKQNGFYSILDYADVPVVEKINLPQTAIILANNLALGRFLDHRILTIDRNYGYAEFEEQLNFKLASKGKAYTDLRMIKGQEKRIRKESLKREIIKSFEKLRKFV